eukprot:Clim_evm27s47 gene=Clim_evmTU27s47
MDEGVSAEPEATVFSLEVLITSTLNVLYTYYLLTPFNIVVSHPWVLLFPFIGPLTGMSFGFRYTYIGLLESILTTASRWHKRRKSRIHRYERRLSQSNTMNPSNGNNYKRKSAGHETSETDTEVESDALLRHRGALAPSRLYKQTLQTTVEESGEGREELAGALKRVRSYNTLRREFNISLIIDFVQDGMNAIVNDRVTKRFKSEELKTWNLLGRNIHQFDEESIPLVLYPLYIIGVFIRYFILFPYRFLFGLVGVILFVIFFSIIAMIPRGWFRRKVERFCSFIVARHFVLAWSAVVRYHEVQNRPQCGSICVANHTSPIDCIILANDQCYSMVGQAHGGFIGMLQSTLSIAQTHIWFNRSESKDRAAVAKKLREHCEQGDENPIVIFPEGTCINNTSVMMFKKGSFEVGVPVYPVAIKYNPIFANCFWDSSQDSFFQHCLKLMTTWAVVADVWYMPVEHRRPNESSMQFAARVKKQIASKGGLVDLEFDGFLKRKRLNSNVRTDLQKALVDNVDFEVDDKVDDDDDPDEEFF